MSPVRELSEVKVAFVDHLKDVEKVMDYLRQNKTISKEEEARVAAKGTVSEKNRELFAVLEANSWEQIQGSFREILLKTNNQYLFDKINVRDGDASLKTLIHQNLVYLTAHLCDISSVLIHLLQDGFITDNELDRINSERTGNDKATELFQTLMRRDVQDTAAIIAIFRKTGNQQLAEKLRPSLS